MVAHSWGSGFDFDRLGEAGKQIENIYKAISGNQLLWKEKWGTIRYEWILVPGKTLVDEETGELIKDELQYVPLYDEDFLFAVHLTCVDYPDMVAEILDDWLFHNNWEEVNKHRKNTRKEQEEDI